jgi:hypothetical protein
VTAHEKLAKVPHTYEGEVSLPCNVQLWAKIIFRYEMLKSYKNILKASFVDSIDVSSFKRGINALELSTFRIDSIYVRSLYDGSSVEA